MLQVATHFDHSMQSPLAMTDRVRLFDGRFAMKAAACGLKLKPHSEIPAQDMDNLSNLDTS